MDVLVTGASTVVIAGGGTITRHLLHTVHALLFNKLGPRRVDTRDTVSWAIRNIWVEDATVAVLNFNSSCVARVAGST